ncbi:hypothetical protein K7432_004479 [Basidiobolus ranarum]|uniref:Uncharacterized protein n=1 Tax=Basidiobolus ranarum TaxID=34480 RepID=A0ABR2W4L5_9FUNG
MPVLEVVGGLIGAAIVCSMVVRKVHIKKQKAKVNKMTKALWKRRKFIYGSPRVTPVTSTGANTTTANNDETGQTLANVNYYPSASAMVTPNIILPPIHFRSNHHYPQFSSNIPIADLPTMSQTASAREFVACNGNLPRENVNHFELQSLPPPTPPASALYREIPSAPSLAESENMEQEYPELSTSTFSSQLPSAPTLDHFELSESIATTTISKECLVG